MLEIERKWLVTDITDNLLSRADITMGWADISYIEQSDAEFVYRLSRRFFPGKNKEQSYKITRKSASYTQSRVEEADSISKEVYYMLLDKLCAGRVQIIKHRFIWKYKGLTMELDKFHSPQSFWLLEVETPTQDTKIKLPPQLIIEREVTGDPDYYGQNIAKRIRI